jgi:hypothetical protein
MPWGVAEKKHVRVNLWQRPRPESLADLFRETVGITGGDKGLLRDLAGHLAGLYKLSVSR